MKAITATFPGARYNYNRGHYAVLPPS